LSVNHDSSATPVSGSVRLRRLLIISGFGLLALLITLVTLYLIFQGGARREGVGLAGATVKPFTTFEGNTVYPFGLAKDATGTLHVSSFGEGRIYKIGADGSAIRWIEPNTGLTAPAALTLAPDNTLYVIDFSSSDPNKGIGTIRQISADGKITTPAATQGITGLSFLSGLTVAPNGDLYVSITARGEVWKFAPGKAGEVWATLPRISIITPAANSNTPQVAQPTAIIFDGMNLLYVADSDSGRIYRYPVKADGTADQPAEVITLVDKTVAGFALDGQGRLLFTQWAKEDGWLNRIERTGGMTQLARNFRAPAGVAIVNNGVYVVNSDLPGLLRQGFVSIFSGAKPPFTLDSVTLP
jgi:sugar lactone lactonase YvrE